jgi:hypothetical protein
MPTRPADVWSHLPRSLRVQIGDDLAAILQEVIHEQLRVW